MGRKPEELCEMRSLRCNSAFSTDLLQAGVWWINRDWNDYTDINDEEDDYSTNVYFTRLHVRYNRDKFPQDLQFQVTPNTENYQARYIITHPATGDLNCDAGKKYLKQLKQRRSDEMEMLTYLTGKNYEDWDVLASEEDNYIPSEATYATVSKEAGSQARTGKNGILFAGIGLIGMISLIGLGRRK